MSAKLWPSDDDWQRAVREYKRRATLRKSSVWTCELCGEEVLSSHSLLVAKDGGVAHLTCVYTMGVAERGKLDVGTFNLVTPPAERKKFVPSVVPDTLRELVEGK